MLYSRVAFLFVVVVAAIANRRCCTELITISSPDTNDGMIAFHQRNAQTKLVCPSPFGHRPSKAA